MKFKVAFSVLLSLILLSCQNRFYSEGDFTSVLKIDSHVHINNDKGYFEDQAKQDNFLLVTLNVDHSDSANIKKQLDYALLSTQKHPDLKFIGCHLGSLEWNVDSLAKRLNKFPNMVVDMSARICHLQYQSAQNRKRIRDFCIKYQDRLLYGTDTGDNGTADPEEFKESMHGTWLDDWKYFATNEEMTSDKFKGAFTGLKLLKKVVDKIYSENAIKWYKLYPPAPQMGG